MVGSIGNTTQIPGLNAHSRPAEAQERSQQPDLMPLRRPGETGLERSQEIREEQQKEVKKDPEFLLHHTKATLEERMKQVLSEKDIKMLLYMTAPLPRTEDTMPEPGRLFDVLV